MSGCLSHFLCVCVCVFARTFVCVSFCRQSRWRVLDPQGMCITQQPLPSTSCFLPHVLCFVCTHQGTTRWRSYICTAPESFQNICCWCYCAHARLPPSLSLSLYVCVCVVYTMHGYARTHRLTLCERSHKRKLCVKRLVRAVTAAFSLICVALVLLWCCVLLRQNHRCLKRQPTTFCTSSTRRTCAVSTLRS